MAERRNFRKLERIPAGIMQSQNPDSPGRRQILLDRELEADKIEGSVEDLVVTDSFAHTGGLIGLNGRPVTGPGGPFTQTYATAALTNATPSGTALTHTVGTANGTVEDAGAAYDQTITNNNNKEFSTQINNLVADNANIKQVVNAVIDYLQLRGDVT